MKFKHLLIISLILLTAGLSLSALCARDTNRPNVILIYTDDQGTVDMNCYGAKDLHTPGMDALAYSGIRFTQFYVAAPVCSPSRAALMTGNTPFNAGVPRNSTHTYGDPLGMPGEQYTFAEMMKDSGYSTAHIGKWHLGYVEEKMPLAQGFDFSFGHMGGCIDNYSHFYYWGGANRHDLWKGGKEIYRPGNFFLDMMEEEAYAFIRENRDRPFFLYFAVNMPHYPLQGKPEWLEYYRDLPSPRREYAAFVSTIDEAVGRLTDYLEAQGLTEDTIIIFQSDHGHSNEERTFGAGGSAGPYRGSKFSLFEGGIRTPAIISWKGHIKGNQVRNQIGVNVDWMPTVAELCGIGIPEQVIDGRSLLPVIEDKKAPSPHDTFFWHYPSVTMHRGEAQWAVRRGPWKLIVNGVDHSGTRGPLDPMKDKYFLVNFDLDYTETSNFAQQNPDKVEEPKNLHIQWFREIEEKIH